ncbi:hypothetical protein OIU74_009670 [Salix koriyanagi]|uniref:Uncharacterized protein n=1 Tax=Salix koriyanagi TaxID=2511006 RepID=A0A9Q0Z133_9ROSI|nr:hypothetical protein OIU74_009670 [Salix koriyanagi]
MKDLHVFQFRHEWNADESIRATDEASNVPDLIAIIRRQRQQVSIQLDGEIANHLNNRYKLKQKFTTPVSPQQGHKFVFVLTFDNHQSVQQVNGDATRTIHICASKQQTVHVSNSDLRACYGQKRRHAQANGRYTPLEKKRKLKKILAAFAEGGEVSYPWRCDAGR